MIIISEFSSYMKSIIIFAAHIIQLKLHSNNYRRQPPNPTKYGRTATELL